MIFSEVFEGKTITNPNIIDKNYNTIEGFNRQLRKVTKAKTVFPTDESLLKVLYLTTMDIVKKWTNKPHNWALIMSQLLIMVPERLSIDDLN